MSVTKRSTPNSAYTLPSSITFSDTSWNQIDIRGMAGADMEVYVGNLKSRDPPRGYWSTEMIDGKLVDVITFPVGESGPNKAETGGKTYFIRWHEPVSDSAIEKEGMIDMGIIITKQSLGDESFEAGFQHFMSTLNLDEFARRQKFAYPTL